MTGVGIFIAVVLTYLIVGAAIYRIFTMYHKYKQITEDYESAYLLVAFGWPISWVVLIVFFIGKSILNLVKNLSPKAVAFKVVHYRGYTGNSGFLRDFNSSDLFEKSLINGIATLGKYDAEAIENLLQVMKYKKQHNGVYTKVVFGKLLTRDEAIEILSK